jgi:D-sedoheptulose 7-phosphate isomerase
VLALTGRTGGSLAARADLCLRVPSDETERIQEAHITIIHLLCEIVERTLFPDSPSA